MKGRRFTALCLALTACLLLSSCASMLERSYEASSPHVDRPATAEGSSALRVGTYQELVSAVLYLVSRGEAEGAIQLYDYSGDVEGDLSRACLEVANEDPLGAYAVDYIRYEYTRVMSYYQASVSVGYRRTVEQIRSIVNVTGTSAIRAELQEALSAFSTEVVLRVAYFAEDEGSITDLIRQAYYDIPLYALGMPESEIYLYPDSGSQRVVEILLTYPEPVETLQRKSEALSQALDGFYSFRELAPAAAARQVLTDLCLPCTFVEGGGATAYDALVAREAGEEGLALGYALVCQRLEGVTCSVVPGSLNGRSWFWNELRFENGTVTYVDPARFAEFSTTFFTAAEMAEMGYSWPGEPTAG